jgi:cholesterol oxidase
MKNTSFDYIVIGSGFGGSTSALRLTEKGYKVAVLEKGREFKDSEFPKTNWNIKKYLWAPIFKCFGIQKITWFKDVLILSGTGVGGGSLVYANTLMTPPDAFYQNQVWSRFKDWKTVLEPSYTKAKYMLGVTENPWRHEADEILLNVAKDLGKEETVENVKVGVYFGDETKEVDPYFNGHGPLRKGCTGCAGCMVGCRFNAKNTLVKNYLFFARKFGAKVFAKTYVDKIEFKKDRYYIHTYKTGSWFKTNRIVFETRGLVISGGVLGSMDLLLRQKYQYKTLPKISSCLGNNIRTNSEMLCSVTTKDKKMNEGVAISSIMNPDENTHVEIVKYSNGSDFMKLLTMPFTKFQKIPWRFLSSLKEVLFHPFKYIKMYWFSHWASNSIIFLVMQHLDSSMKMQLKGFPFKYLSLKNGSEKVPAFIPSGADVMNRFSEKVDGTPSSCFTEILLDKPATAHILGGAPIGESSKSGVVNDNFEVHGYNNFYILDGSIVPCNIGVNPSLTITALTEYAMSKVPNSESGQVFSVDKLIESPCNN